MDNAIDWLYGRGASETMEPRAIGTRRRALLDRQKEYIDARDSLFGEMQRKLDEYRTILMAEYKAQEKVLEDSLHKDLKDRGLSFNEDSAC